LAALRVMAPTRGRGGRAGTAAEVVALLVRDQWLRPTCERIPGAPVSSAGGAAQHLPRRRPPRTPPVHRQGPGALLRAVAAALGAGTHVVLGQHAQLVGQAAAQACNDGLVVGADVHRDELAVMAVVHLQLVALDGRAVAPGRRPLQRDTVLALSHLQARSGGSGVAVGPGRWGSS
jgi:hypothetical protein